MTDALQAEREELLGSLLTFTQVFYKALTGRDFELRLPIGRKSHYLIVIEALEDVFYGRTTNLIINIPPGHAKSTMLKMFVAWCWAHYPDCNFLYISHTASLAERHTFEIKQIIELPLYRRLFGVELRADSKAKAKFTSNYGGSIKAFGSAGAITGEDAGLPYLDRFSGANIMDDMHQPDEVFSETARQGVVDNYRNTIRERRRGKSEDFFITPQIMLGQRLHEQDVCQYMLDGKDGYEWTSIILKSLDEHDNALCPALVSREELLRLRQFEPYVFWAQHQQTPAPIGNSIYNPSDFVIIEEEPTILATFITADTAETDKTYNDATVFSFWGIYKIKQFGVETDLLGLHWIDCWELRVLPKFLLSEFMQFYSGCLRHPVPPKLAIVEKKSTGVTLLSILGDIQGIQVRDFTRDKSKAARFSQIQPYIGEKRVSFPKYGKHNEMCISHMSKITLNNAHAFDDICDSSADAIRAAFIDKILDPYIKTTATQSNKARIVMGSFLEQERLRKGVVIAPTMGSPWGR